MKYGLVIHLLNKLRETRPISLLGFVLPSKISPCLKATTIISNNTDNNRIKAINGAFIP
jgi:hypothetical protein